MIFDFKREDFFPLTQKKIFIRDLKNILKDLIIDSNLKDNFEIKEISSLNLIRNNSILFFEKNNVIPDISNENICIITNDVSIKSSNLKNTLIINNLDSAYKLICNAIFVHDDSLNYFDEFDYVNGSFISKYSKISESSLIGKNCLIGRGVTIDNNSIIKNNVVIKNSIISKNVIICDNSTIGSTGFGFDFYNRGATNLSPQLGIVIVDSNTHIGSNCCIDRGKIDYTYIGKNCMIDNLVHIAHNVYLSDNACIAAQTGISGSVFIDSNVTVGGQSGFAGHIKIGKNVTIAAKSGVTKNIDNNKTVAGFPATDIKSWKRNIIKERKNGYK